MHDFSLSCVSSVSFRGRFAARMHLNLKHANQKYIYPFGSLAGNDIYQNLISQYTNNRQHTET
jgi:hypothetical protein